MGILHMYALPNIITDDEAMIFTLIINIFPGAPRYQCFNTRGRDVPEEDDEEDVEETEEELTIQVELDIDDGEDEEEDEEEIEALEDMMMGDGM